MAWLTGSDPATTDTLETSTGYLPKKQPVVGTTDRLKVLPPGAGDAPAAGLAWNGRVDASYTNAPTRDTLEGIGQTPRQPGPDRGPIE